MAQTDIGTILSVVAAEPATYDPTGWGDVTGWLEVGEVASIGERGDDHETVNVPADLKTGRSKYVKGAAMGGEVGVSVRNIDYADAGQDLVRTACAAIPEATSTLSVREADAQGNVNYYRAVFKGWKRIEASGTSYRGGTFTMMVNTSRVVVEA